MALTTLENVGPDQSLFDDHRLPHALLDGGETSESCTTFPSICSCRKPEPSTSWIVATSTLPAFMCCTKPGPSSSRVPSRTSMLIASFGADGSLDRAFPTRLCKPLLQRTPLKFDQAVLRHVGSGTSSSPSSRSASSPDPHLRIITCGKRKRCNAANNQPIEALVEDHLYLILSTLLPVRGKTRTPNLNPTPRSRWPLRPSKTYVAFSNALDGETSRSASGFANATRSRLQGSKPLLQRTRSSKSRSSPGHLRIISGLLRPHAVT